MILSKGNLAVNLVTVKDKDIDALDNIHICTDGTSVGCAGDVVVAVSPVRLQVKEQLKQLEETELKKDVTFSTAFAKKLDKNMPKDKILKGLLEHCELEIRGNTDVKVTFHDGESPFIVRGKQYKGLFAPFAKILRNVLGKRDKNSVKVIVNRVRLKLLLDVFDKVCAGNTEEAIFIEFTKDNDVILRGLSELTGQRVLATMKSYLFNPEKWLKHDRWEKKMQGEEKFIYRRRTS